MPKIIVGLMLFLVGWIVYRQVLWGSTPPVDISIIYAPEAEPFMPQVIEAFNQSFARGINPVTGEALAQNQRPIHVSGRSGSSGVVQQGIVNALLAPNNANVERPTLFSPSTSIWLTLANHAAGREIFTPKASPATALDAVVIAIWESQLKALQAKAGNQPIGWEELFIIGPKN